MIVVEAGPNNEKSFDAKVLFAIQLANNGHHVAIDQSSLPETLNRYQKYDVAPFACDVAGVAISNFILIGAEEISTESLARIHSYGLGSDVRVSATGYFQNEQARIAASAKIAYGLGHEANVVDLFSLQKHPLLTAPIAPAFCTHQNAEVSGSKRPLRLYVFLPSEMLEEPETLALFGAIDHHAGFRLTIISAGHGVDLIRNSSFSNVDAHGLTELSPSTFANAADIVAFFGDSVPGERMAHLALAVLQSSGLLVDCTTSGIFVARGAPALRGPAQPAALSNFLDHTFIPNIVEIGRQARNANWTKDVAFRRLETVLKLDRPRNDLKNQTAHKPRTVFLPTNGNGLGHAKRCTLIAKEFPSTSDVSFLAFPSCVPLVNRAGFAALPLVQKSDDHKISYANDIVNQLRLRTLLRDGDRLVFDGGYVFDSVYRTILEKRLAATWIRRGLWQPGQIKSTAFARERAFEKVIVPAEAFDELNARYTYGNNIYPVGPIVEQRFDQRFDPSIFREKLGQRFGHCCARLVVTMLGGGVAADRSAQLQTICSMLERRKDCLHLIVVWPGAKVLPGLYGWKNTQVVKTQDALSLARAADFVISAVGYNSFHEILYHDIPSILVPQFAPYMDDQKTRALAAAERGLAALVDARAFLQLEREISAFFDDGKADEIKTALQNATLPKTGNQEAAALIAEKIPT